MKHSEKITPVAAAVSALSTMACCLPSGIAAAAGAAGLGVVLEPFRSWLMGYQSGSSRLGWFSSTEQIERVHGGVRSVSRSSWCPRSWS